MKTLPELATNLMKEWYDAHSDKPYPTESERQELARLGQITENQVKAWFANKRNRTFNTRTKLKRLNNNNLNKSLDLHHAQTIQQLTLNQHKSSNKNIAIKPRLEPKINIGQQQQQLQQQQQFSLYHPLVINASLVGSPLFGSTNSPQTIQKCYESCCQPLPSSSSSTASSSSLINQSSPNIYFPHSYLLNTSPVTTASFLHQPQFNKQPILFFPSPSTLDLNNNNTNTSNLNLNLNKSTKLVNNSTKQVKSNSIKSIMTSQYEQSTANDYTSQLLSLIHQFEPKCEPQQLQQSPPTQLNYFNPFILNSQVINSSYLQQNQQQLQQQTKCTDLCCNPSPITPSPAPSNASSCNSNSFNQSTISISDRSTPLISYPNSATTNLENNDWNLLECSYCSDNLENVNTNCNTNCNNSSLSPNRNINTNKQHNLNTNQCEYYSPNNSNSATSSNGSNQAWLAAYSSNVQQCDTPPPIIPANSNHQTSTSNDLVASDQSTRFKFKCSLKNRYFQSK